MEPVSFVKVTARIAGLFLRRFGNWMGGRLRRRRRGAGRTGTGRKETGNLLGMMAILVVFVFNSVNLAAEAMKTLAS